MKTTGFAKVRGGLLDGNWNLMVNVTHLNNQRRAALGKPGVKMTPRKRLLLSAIQRSRQK